MRALLSCAVMLVMLAFCTRASAQPIQTVLATPIGDVEYRLAQAGTHLIQVEAVTPGADPVLHIVDSSYRQVAMAEDFGAGASVNVPLLAATYRILIRASSNHTGGRARLWIDGQVNGEYDFGGAFVRAPTAMPMRYETTGLPGGHWNAKLFAIACDGSISAMDNGSGVGFFSRLEASANRPYYGRDCEVMVASWWGSGNVRVLFNDYTRDQDRDGVGAALEQALQSCDSLAQPGCKGVFNTQDSDRDGLSDQIETFGLDDPISPQQLPFWGSNPARKDMFFELHSVSTLTNVWQPYSPDALRDAQKAYGAGEASDLGNLDGSRGVALHFDAPMNPVIPQDIGLYGFFGGFTVVTKPGDRYPYWNDRLSTDVRRGIFRLILADTGGGGQSNMGSQKAGLGAGVGTLVHEVGHFVGLNHWSKAQREPINCAPNYPSVMNYLYSGRPQFSRGDNPQVLNPMRVDELQPFAGDTTALSNATRYVVNASGQVDWNRDGAITGTVKAPITGHSSSCAAYARHETASLVSERNTTSQTLSNASPKLTRIGDRLYQFYVAQGEIRWLSGALNNNGCFENTYRGACVRAWDRTGRLPSIAGVERIGLTQAWDRLYVAYREINGPIKVVSLPLSSFPVPQASNVSAPEQLYNYAWMDSEPELVSIRMPTVTGAEAPALSVHYTRMYLDPSDGFIRVVHAQAYKPNASAPFVDLGPIIGSEGRVLDGRFGAGLFTWGSGAEQKTCGIFDNDTARVSYRCYDAAFGRWTNLSAAAGINWMVTGKPSIAFNYARNMDGTLVGGDSRNGTIVAVAPVAGDRIPSHWQLRSVSAMSPPHRPRAFVDLGTLYNVWTHLERGASVALYQDVGMPSLMGTYTLITRLETDPGSNLRRLYFQPMLEGIFNNDLVDGNDFRMMEREVCVGLRYALGRNDAAAFCNTINQWGF